MENVNTDLWPASSATQKLEKQIFFFLWEMKKHMCCRNCKDVWLHMTQSPFLIWFIYHALMSRQSWFPLYLFICLWRDKLHCAGTKNQTSTPSLIRDCLYDRWLFVSNTCTIYFLPPGGSVCQGESEVCHRATGVIGIMCKLIVMFIIIYSRVIYWMHELVQ